jgi:MOSC domain-containing protein YiiM
MKAVTFGPGQLGENITTSGLDLLDRAEDGSLIRKCGVTAAAVNGGEVLLETAIQLTSMPAEQVAFEPV